MNNNPTEPLDTSTPSEGWPFRGARTGLKVGVVSGLLGAGLLIAGAFTDAKQTAFSYLIAYAYTLGIVLGAMAFVMAVHAMNATWPTALRRLPEAIMACFPLLLILFLPVLASAELLYPWTVPDLIADAEMRHLVEHKEPYLNLPFATIRAAVFFTFWIAVSTILRKWSLRMDHPKPLAILRIRMRWLSSGALPFFGLFGTMWAWDWLMSLSPDWFSTMFGLYYLAGGFLGAIATIIILAVLGQRAGFFVRVGPSHYYALGRLLFAFLIFWAYTSYFQYFLIWAANKPIEVRWFIVRTTGAYAWVAWFIVIGHFALPFLILLSYWIKQRAWGIAVMAGWIAVARYVEVHWMIAAARDRPAPFSWLDAAALLFIVGTTLAFGLWRQSGVALAPIHDPTFAHALEYQSQ